MGLKEETIEVYTLVCDGGGCKQKTPTYDDLKSLVEESRKAGWIIARVLTEWLCPACAKKYLLSLALLGSMVSDNNNKE